MVAYMAFSQSFANFTELSYLPHCMLPVAPTPTRTDTSNLPYASACKIHAMFVGSKRLESAAIRPCLISTARRRLKVA